MKRNATEIARNVIQKVWEKYVARVPYVREYARLISGEEGRLVLDHLAFRTFNTHTGEQPEGITAIGHILRALGYRRAANYVFKKKRLSAVHFEPTENHLPKIFVSQLEVGDLPLWAQILIKETVKETPYLLSDAGIEILGYLMQDGIITSESADILEDEMVAYFVRPWGIPLKESVLKLNDISQYAAWVLLHGNSVSHFAVSLNGPQDKNAPDIETAAMVLRQNGIPMKEAVEGTPGSPLQQTATLAVKEKMEVRTNEGPEEMVWTYAYFELLKRGFTGTETPPDLFQGFITGQERHFFNMTQTRDN